MEFSEGGLDVWPSCVALTSWEALADTGWLLFCTESVLREVCPKLVHIQEA